MEWASHFFESGDYGEERGGLRRPALASLRDVFVTSFGEGHHFDAWKHVVFDADRGDFASIIGVDEENTAGVPEVLVVLLAGFDAEFQSLSCHFEDPFAMFR